MTLFNMLFKNTMILVLVVCQLASWVRSEQEVSADIDVNRRELLKRRMLERLAERGHDAAEREYLAEELLARLEAHTTTEKPYFRLRREHTHHSSLPPRLEEAAMRLVDTPELEGQEIAPLSFLHNSQEKEEEEEEEEEVPEILEEEWQLEEAPELEQMRKYLQDEMEEDRLIQESPRRLQRSNQRRERERKRNNKKKKREEKKRKSRRYKRLREQEDVLIKTNDGQEFLECCPSKLVVSQIKLGISRDNQPMEIQPSHQYFYERVCREGIEDKECVFPPRTLKRDVTTRCEQQFSNTQAIARPFQTNEEYKLHHIRVRSGCSCQINVTQGKKKRKRKR